MIYYNRKGQPIADTLEWAKLIEDLNYKIVKQEYIGDYWISTVWLGLDHSFGHGAPLIFETMVFSKEETEEVRILNRVRKFRKEFDQVRYTTEQEALAGHHELVEKYRQI